MKRMIASPGAYIQGKGELSSLAENYRQLGSKGAYILIDSFIYDHYLDQIESSFKKNGVPYQSVVFGGECSMAEIHKHENQLGDCDVIIGIGGGKTLDTAKGIGYYAGIPDIIVPTAASSDAPCSRLAVVYTEDHEFDQYLPLNANPSMVIVDTEIIAGAPARSLMAGIGDAMATFFEADACRRANAVTMTGGHVSLGAFALATLCKDTLLRDGLQAKFAAAQHVVTPALENVVEANTYLSSIGFESSGLAAAHAIHDGLTVLEETHKFLHGEKVAFGTVTQLILEDKPLAELKEIIIFQHQCGLPVCMKDLGIENCSDEQLLKAAEIACAPDDTMKNMPFTVEPADIVAAMKTTDALAEMFLSKNN